MLTLKELCAFNGIYDAIREDQASSRNRSPARKSEEDCKGNPESRWYGVSPECTCTSRVIEAARTMAI